MQMQARADSRSQSIMTSNIAMLLHLSSNLILSGTEGWMTEAVKIEHDEATGCVAVRCADLSGLQESPGDWASPCMSNCTAVSPWFMSMMVW